jgi:hypothetical protein
MQIIKIEVLIKPTSHPIHGTGIEVMIDNNIKPNIGQFSPDSQEMISMLFSMITDSVRLISILHGSQHSACIQMPGDSELGINLGKQFRQSEEGQ